MAALRSPDRCRDLDREPVHGLALLTCQAGRRRLFHQLLVTPLCRTITLAQGDDVALAVAQQLDLDVASALDEMLEVHRTVSEGLLGLASRGRDRGSQLGGHRRPDACHGHHHQRRP